MTGAKAASPPFSTSAPGRPAGHDWEGLHRDFQRDGAVLLRGLFSEADMALLRAGVEAHLADPGPEAATASPSGDPGRFWEDFRGFWRHQAYQDFVRTSAAAEAAHRLTGSPEVRLHHDHLLIKEAGARQKTPWHQDQPYYDFEGSQTVSLWIPLDPVPLEASLRFAARTHLGPWLMPKTFLTEERRWFKEGSLAEVPDLDADPSAAEILSWPLEPGDALAFHMLTLHAASGSKALRRALSLRFIGTDVVYAPRSWRTSPAFPELKNALRPGAPMIHPLFPVVWPKADG